MVIYSPPLWAAEQAATRSAAFFHLPSRLWKPGLCHQPHQYDIPASCSGQRDWRGCASALPRLCQHLLFQCSASTLVRDRAHNLLAYKKNFEQTSDLLLTGTETDSPAPVFLALWFLRSKAKWLLREQHDLQARKKKLIKTNRKRTVSPLRPDQFMDWDTGVLAMLTLKHGFDPETLPSQINPQAT